MKPRLYLETTIPSYLVARRSRDLRLAADQATTEEWWEDRRHEFDLFVSEAPYWLKLGEETRKWLQRESRNCKVSRSSKGRPLLTNWRRNCWQTGYSRRMHRLTRSISVWRPLMTWTILLRGTVRITIPFCGVELNKPAVRADLFVRLFALRENCST